MGFCSLILILEFHGLISNIVACRHLPRDIHESSSQPSIPNNQDATQVALSEFVNSPLDMGNLDHIATESKDQFRCSEHC